MSQGSPLLVVWLGCPCPLLGSPLLSRPPVFSGPVSTPVFEVLGLTSCPFPSACPPSLPPGPFPGHQPFSGGGATLVRTEPGVAATPAGPRPAPCKGENPWLCGTTSPMDDGRPWPHEAFLADGMFTGASAVTPQKGAGCGALFCEGRGWCVMAPEPWHTALRGLGAPDVGPLHLSPSSK